MSPEVRAASLFVLGLLGALPRGGVAQALTLPMAVDSALATHPALEGALARAAAAEQGVDAARAARLPSLALEASLNRFEEPMVTTPIHGFDPDRLPRFDETLVQGSLALRQTLLDWGDRSATILAARAEADALDASTQVVRSDLIARVADAYLRVRTARAIDEAAAARLESLEAEHDRVTRALTVGTAAEVEVLRASAALQDARAERTSTVGAARLAERDLARLMGMGEEAVASAELAEVEAPEAVVPSDILDGSPVVEEARLRSEGARSRLRAHRAGRLPRLDASAALLDYGTLSDEHVLEWRAGVSLSWPLFTGGARAASIRRAEAELLAAEHAVDAARLEIGARSDAARATIEAADARVEALETSVAQWTDLVRVETLALEAGAGVQRDLLDAEAGLFRARAGLVGARAEAVMARVRLAAALGLLDRTWIYDLVGGAAP